MSALLELSFADTKALKKEGRNFNCAQCPIGVQKIRRCREDREDFTYEDSAQFPIFIHKGGKGYGFCPAKVTWDQHIVGYYRILILVAEMKVFPNGEPLEKQDPELLDILSWFIPLYQQNKFAQNIQMMFGGSSSENKKGRSHGSNRRAPRKSFNRR